MKFTGERFVPAKPGVIALQHYHRYEFALHLVDFSEKTVLDIACGEGYGTDILASQAEKVYGVDISKEAIKYAKTSYKSDKLKFLLGDVIRIPFSDNSFDIVVSFETIEHHNMHDEMIKDIKRVLKKNGALIISSPNKGYYEKYYPNFKNEFHVKELHKNEFDILLRRHFRNLYSFAQNNVFGSVITCEAKYSDVFSLPLFFNKTHGATVFFEPRFTIAIASDKDLDFNVTTSFFSYTPESDPFTEVENLKETIKRIYSSNTWRVISMLKKPFVFLKGLIKHDL
jgi:2-polyprenyl-3-methyl-5-hydroxy-6-metoxy-1,4-benzoquinol methylase